MGPAVLMRCGNGWLWLTWTCRAVLVVQVPGIRHRRHRPGTPVLPAVAGADRGGAAVPGLRRVPESGPRRDCAGRLFTSKITPYDRRRALTDIGTIIWPDDTIPDDVTAFTDSHSDAFTRAGTDRWDSPETAQMSSAYVLKHWAPLTVTAVAP